MGAHPRLDRRDRSHGDAGRGDAETGLVVAPLSEKFQEEDPTLADQIVATSWTHMLRRGSFDEEALSDFTDDYRGPQGDAPEKFELDQLQQGSN